MTIKKTNKRNFIISLIVLLVYAFVFVGSTFAWFTDEAKTNINKMLVGNLDVSLLMKNSSNEWVSAENETLEFQALDGTTPSTVYWEPSATYRLPEIKVVNEGNLELTYSLLINEIEGDEELAKVLDVWIKTDDGEWDKNIGTLYSFMSSVDGISSGDLAKGEESSVYTIALHMREDATTEYENKTISNMSLKVIAKQKNDTRASNYIDLSNDTIALMSNYMPNAKLTQYSGLNVSEITVNAEEAGQLYIGTAKVSDVVNARTTGVTYTSNSTAYNVVRGTNTISLSLDVAEDETIVLGGNGSVSLAYTPGSNSNDEDGLFTTIDGSTHTDVLNKTNNKNDKLNIQFKVPTIEEVAIFENVLTDFPESKLSTGIAGTMSAAPFVYVNAASQMSGKTITKIGYPVKTVSSFPNAPYFTVSKVVMGENWTTERKGTITDQYTVTIPLSEFTQTSNGNSVNQWVYVDVTDLNITLAENETLGFGLTGDTAVMAYFNTSVGDQDYGFTWNFGPETSGSDKSLDHSLLVDLYYKETVSGSNNSEAITDNIERITKLEEEAKFKAQLSGKTLSILGDSISTYEGYSNTGERNTTNAASDTKSNSVYYGNLNKTIQVEDTWWKQAIDQYDMELLVNNSWGGSRVTNDNDTQWGTGYAGWETRPVNLHDNTTDNNPNNEVINPDIIAVYIGVNDIGAGISVGTKTLNEDFFDTIESAVDNDTITTDPTTFEEAYAIMIYKMVKTYNSSDIFVFNIPTTKNSTNLTTYNSVIKGIAEHYSLPIVDLYGSKLNTTQTSDNLHPTAAGMDIMTEVFIETLKNFYK